tara:strand:- start:366 stop:473 length:108 start_codon:yes stop_codon:yes gene_type:complete
MAIFATIAFIGSAVFGAYKLTPKKQSNIDNELVPW